MHVAVCIVGFRNPGDIEHCLQALSAQSHRDFEVVICENGGEQAFAGLQERLPPQLPGGQSVRIFSAPDNPGYAGGVNVCIRNSREADAWWVLNPDTDPRPEALAAMVARLGRGDCDAVGSVLQAPGGQVQSYGGRWRRWLARPESIGHGRGADESVDVAEVERQLSYLSGASMLVGSRFVERAGLMREDYFLYCEEVEWCLRAVRLGLRLGLAADARVEHHQGSTTGSGAGLRERQRLPIFLDERNKILVMRDVYPSLVLPFATAGALTMLFLRYARRRAWRQLRFGIEGWLSGVRNQRGKPDWLDRRPSTPSFEA